MRVLRARYRSGEEFLRHYQHRAKLRAGLGIEFLPTEGRRRDYLLGVARGQVRQVIVRRHRRLPVSMPAEWRLVQEREVHKSTVEDIGPGGAFIRSTLPIQPGSEVVLGVVPPGSVCPVEIAGRVVWSRQVPGEDGFGIEFRCRDAGGVRRLKELVRRLEQLEEQSLLLSDEDTGPE